MTNPVVHFEIVGCDGAALVQFYRRLFGWDLREAAMPGHRPVLGPAGQCHRAGALLAAG